VAVVIEQPEDELSQDYRRRSIVLLLKDALRDTEEEVGMPVWPILEGLEMLWQEIPIHDHDERNLCGNLLRTGWSLVPAYDEKRHERFMRLVNEEPEPENKARFHIKPAGEGQWLYHMQDSDGTIQYTSETFPTRASAQDGVIEAVRSTFAAAGMRWSDQEEKEVLKEVVYE
jgi:uncharacterized protein YegP (UPF0339 family)